jgi:signal peptidase II
VLRISHWTNDGAAFSLFANSASPHAVRWGLICFSSLAALVVLVVMIRLADRFTLTSVALALIFAGALGNVHDRIAYGSVVDFIEVHIFSYHFPTSMSPTRPSASALACCCWIRMLPKKNSGN